MRIKSKLVSFFANYVLKNCCLIYSKNNINYNNFYTSQYSTIVLLFS